MKTNKDKNYLNDLTDAEILDVWAIWDMDIKGENTRWPWGTYDITRAYPEWCFANNRHRALNTNPHWVAINEPEFAFQRDPLMMLIANNRWVQLNRPDYYAIHKALSRSMGYGHDVGVQPLID